MANININSFDELEDFLRNWMSFKDQEIYDLIGMGALIAACLDNLEQHMNKTDFKEISFCFTERQKDFLKAISARM